MATKFYLHTGTAPYTPATIRGAWDATGSAVTRRLSSDKQNGGTITTVAAAETSASPFKTLLYRGVSGPLAAQTITANLDVILGVIESNAAADMCFRLHVYLTTGDSDTVRATLGTVQETTANEWGTAAGTSGKALAAVLAISQAVTEGDRLVIEIGYIAQNVSATSYTGTLRYGTQLSTDGSVAGDLTASGDGQVLAGFVSFSADVAESAAPFIRDTQVLVKSLRDGAPQVRLSQTLTKTITSYDCPVRVTQTMVKVLRSNSDATATGDKNMIMGCWL